MQSSGIPHMGAQIPLPAGIPATTSRAGAANSAPRPRPPHVLASSPSIRSLGHHWHQVANPLLRCSRQSTSSILPRPGDGAS